MEAKGTAIGLMVFLFSLETLILGADLSTNIRVDPTPFTETLALHETPLSTELFVDAALVFSGVPADELEDQSAPVEILIDRVRSQVVALEAEADRAEFSAAAFPAGSTTLSGRISAAVAPAGTANGSGAFSERNT